MLMFKETRLTYTGKGTNMIKVIKFVDMNDILFKLKGV